MALRGNDIGKGALGVVAGMIVGAGVALVVAPQSGGDTRRDILYYSRRGKRKARRIIEDCSDGFSGLVDSLGHKATDVLEQGKNAAQDARRGILDAIEEGQETLRHQRRKLERLIG